MGADKFNMLIYGFQDDLTAIKSAIDSHPDSMAKVTDYRGLDGNTAAWILVANLGAQALPHILKFVADYAALRRVKKIKVGDIEIENPTARDLEMLRHRIEKVDD